jgi:ABC-2 type transport system permease protein
MILVLVRKLLRDIRVALIIVALLLGAFQCLWAKVTERILGQLAPFFFTLARVGGLTPADIENQVFAGPGKIIRTIIGGENIVLDAAMDMMTIGYVHPLMQTLFCIWAIGRATGAIAGELERGTMELLLSQPLARYRLILAHFLVDVLTIPILCLSLWAGTALGTWLVTPIQPETVELKAPPPRLSYAYIWVWGPVEVRLRNPFASPSAPPAGKGKGDAKALRKQLEIKPWEFGRGLWLVGGLMFAVAGYTLWLSAAGQSRWRVLGIATFLTLLQFLINVLGQLWEPLEPFRPLTIFYYYQPQQVILNGDWYVCLREWNGGQPLLFLPMPVVLYGVGLLGYVMALWTFTRRDLPAPL